MNWDLEEEILLVSLYFRSKTLSDMESNSLIQSLSEFLFYRAKLLNYLTNEKFRNVTGIKMKLKNIMYVDFEGVKGLSQHSEMDKEIVQLYKDNRQSFDEQLKQIFVKYSLDDSFQIYSDIKKSFRDWSNNVKKSCATERNLTCLCEVDKYAIESGISKISIWAIPKDDFRRFITKIVSVPTFNQLNKTVHFGNTIALDMYLNFLKYKAENSNTQTSSENIKYINTNSSAKEQNYDGTNVSALFTDERFSLFVKSLISDGISTLDQLKRYNILRYLNNRNIYSDIDRREISEGILYIIKQAQSSGCASKGLNTKFSFDQVLLNYKNQDKSKLYTEFSNISDSTFFKAIKNGTKIKSYFFRDEYCEMCKFFLINGIENLNILIFVPFERFEIRNKLSDKMIKQVTDGIIKWLDCLESTGAPNNPIDEIMKMLWE